MLKSTSSSRRVLDTAPMAAAVAAIFTGLLNMTEKPNTPQKLNSRRRTRYCVVLRLRFIKSTGVRRSSSAIIQAASVATMTTRIA